MELSRYMLGNEDEVWKSGNVLKRKYTNYNFYFLSTYDGMKEIKKIHIYEGDEILFTLDKPWFGNIYEVNFSREIIRKSSVQFDGEIFYICKDNKLNIELYIPNDCIQMKKVREEDGQGIYERIDVYKSENPILEGFEEKIKIKMCKAKKAKMNAKGFNWGRGW